MSETKSTKILAFVGLPGAGKSSAVDYLTEQAYPKIYFGGIIYQAMNEAGIEITPESQQTFREAIREREGKDFVVRRVIKQAHNLIDSGQHRLLFDGLYTWTEYKILRSEFHSDLEVVAIVAPRRLRHRRLADRPERPFTEPEATERDRSEIENLEKGGPIAIADHYIINDGNLDKLHADIDVLVDKIAFHHS